MFISNVVKKLWEGDSKQFQIIVKKCKEKGTLAVYNELINDMKSLINTEPWVGNLYTFILTSGCSYACGSNAFCGCSYCNFAYGKFDLIAKMKYLRENDINLYSQCARESFKLLNTYRDLFIDEFAIEDSFCKFQFPDQALEAVSSCLVEKPSVLIVQTKASSINEGRYNQLEKLTKKILNISMGMETSNEWIRIHWLNKMIFNKQLINSGEMIEAKRKGRISLNILFGIPGFNILLSIKNFIKTIQWTQGKNWVSCAIVSPLVIKPNTLQQFVNDHCYDEQIYDGNISAISFYFALDQVYSSFSGIRKKLFVSYFALSDFLEQCTENLNVEPKYQTLELEVIDHFKKNIKSAEISRIANDFFLDKISENELYLEYISSLNKYNSNEKTQIIEISKSIIEILFPERRDEFMFEILDEIKNFEVYDEDFELNITKK